MKKSLIILFLFLIISSKVWAHKISIFAYVEGNYIQGQVYFNDGSPAKLAKVTLLPARGHKILGETKTDKEGNFKLLIPKGVEGKVRVVALAEMGHRAEINLSLKPEAKGPQKGEPSFPGAQDFMAPPAQTENPASAGVLLNKEELKALIHQEVEKEVAPIREILEQLVKQLQKPSFSEIFGGIGYIFGFFGILAWAYSKRK